MNGWFDPLGLRLAIADRPTSTKFSCACTQVYAPLNFSIMSQQQCFAKFPPYFVSCEYTCVVTILGYSYTLQCTAFIYIINN